MAIIVPAVSGKIIHIGRAGENLATTVAFDVNQWLEEFGTEGTFTLFVQQNGVGYYVQDIVHTSGAQVETDGGIVQWNVVNSNTINAGLGKCELAYAQESSTALKPLIEGYAISTNSVINFYKDLAGTELIEPNELYRYKDLTQDANPLYYYFDGMQYIGTTEDGPGTHQSIVVKSIIFDIVVTNSLDSEAAGEVPAPIESWLNRVSILTDKIENASDYAVRAETAATSSEESAHFAEAYAKGTIDGVPVTSTQPGYQDNALYYKNEAQQYDERVKNMTAHATTGEPGSNASVTVTKTNISPLKWHLEFEIPRGKGYQIEQTVSTYADLNNIQNPIVNGIYGVDSNHHLYVYNGTSFVDYGVMGGITGDLYTWTV